MPSKTKLKNSAIAERSAALPTILKEVLDQFVQGPMTAEAGNHRNGSTGKTVLTEDGPLRIKVPRDREGSAHSQA